MTEEEAEVIADAIDLIATFRARQCICAMLGDSDDAAHMAELAVKAQTQLVRALIEVTKQKEES